MSGRDDNEYGRYPFGRPSHRRHEDADGNETPVDLAAVQADDALLDMIGRGEAMPSGGADADLTRVLLAWRRDVTAEPVKNLVDTEQAVAVISAARRPAPRRHPMIGLFAAAAAMLVIAFSGLSLAAKSAEPGDRLFGLTKVLYAEHARSVEAAKTVETKLGEAKQAIQQGDAVKAKESLEEAEQQLAVIAETEDQTRLAAEHNKLEEQLQAETGNPAEASKSQEPTSQPSISEEAAVPPPTDSATATTAPEEPTSQTPTPTVDPTTTDPPPSPTSTQGQPPQETLTGTPRAGTPEESPGSTLSAPPPGTSSPSG